MNTEKISGVQLASLMFMIVISTAILLIPGITAEKAAESAWLSVLIALAVGIVNLMLIYYLGKRFPKLTLPEYAEILLGKTLGKILTFGYVLFFLIISITVLREFTDFLNMNLMPETPPYVFQTGLMIVAAYAVIKGIEVIVRVNQFILPLFILSLAVLLALAVRDMDLNNLQPFLDKGVLSVLDASLVPIAWFGQIVVLIFLFPKVNQSEDILKNGILGIIAAGILLTFINIATITVFGPEYTGEMYFAFLYLAKYIKFITIQRLEFLVIFIWVSGIVVKVAVMYYLETMTLVRMFSLKNKKYVLLGLALLNIIAPNLLFESPLDVGYFLKNIWPSIGLTFELLIPGLLLLLTIIEKKKVRRYH
ncbi:endospore germination permease [Dehalobacter sp. 14DCB1]|uniref:GerAB/ArcD/ProY family transporter n=1 Tax=unclassified Dehalobacter TaxID=2635733 RepID=UPI0032B868BC